MIAVPGHEAVKARYWLFDLAEASGERDLLLSSLTGEELARGRRILDREKGEQFLIGRSLLRKTLAGLTWTAPEQVLLGEGEFGKPHLGHDPAASAIRFNLSHAGGYLLLAVTEGAEVGVDLEEMRRDLDYEPMARRFLSRREQDELFALPVDERLEAFYRLWTRKEACLKGVGSGFSQPSTGFDVSLSPQAEVVLMEDREAGAGKRRWSICDLPAPHGFCAAIAVEVVSTSP